MMLFQSDPATLLLAKSPSEHIPIITDVIKELCLERTNDMLVFDVVGLLQDLPLAERVDFLSNRELLETKIKFLNAEQPLPTVDISDIHNPWLQTTDEAIWREVYDPTPSSNFGFIYVNIETGKILSADQIMTPSSSFMVYREDVIWSRSDYTGESLRVHMRLALEYFVRTHQDTLESGDISEEWKYNVLTLGRECATYWVHPIGYIRHADYCNRAKEVSQQHDIKLPTCSPPRVKVCSWLKKKQKALKKLRLLRRLSEHWRTRRQNM
jgi:hypothetical protein